MADKTQKKRKTDVADSKDYHYWGHKELTPKGKTLSGADNIFCVDDFPTCPPMKYPKSEKVILLLYNDFNSSQVYGQIVPAAEWDAKIMETKKDDSSHYIYEHIVRPLMRMNAFIAPYDSNHPLWGVEVRTFLADSDWVADDLTDEEEDDEEEEEEAPPKKPVFKGPTARIATKQD